MNAFSASEFGDVGTVLQALGLVDTDGTLRSDWIKDPAQYLKDILADKDQRKALLDFLTSVSQNGAETDTEDRRWVEVLSDSIGDGQRIGLFAVFDDSPDQAGHEVHLSLGVRLTTTDPHSQSSLMVPLFRTRKGSSPSPSDPTLLGKPGGWVVLTSAITLSQTPPPVGAGRVDQRDHPVPNAPSRRRRGPARGWSCCVGAHPFKRWPPRYCLAADRAAPARRNHRAQPRSCRLLARCWACGPTRRSPASRSKTC